MNSCNAPRQILPALPRNQKPGLLDHVPELLLLREALNALDQVLVTIPIAGDQLAYQRDGAKAPPLVDGIEQGVRDAAELETGEEAAGFQDAVGLAQGDVLVGEVPDAEGDGVQIDRVVGDGVEMLGVGDEEVEARRVGVARGQGALAALVQHGRVDVRDGDGGLRRVVDLVAVLQEAERDVAGAAGDVEHFPALRGLVGARGGPGVDGADEVVPGLAVSWGDSRGAVGRGRREWRTSRDGGSRET